ncbi:MAG: alpha/beta fold hydrolase [Gemmatimonadota bacterium]
MPTDRYRTDKVGRRDAIRMLASACGALALSACAADATAPREIRSGARLLSRPSSPELSSISGLHPLGLGKERDGLIYGPPTYKAGSRVPLLLLLHGAGQSADNLMEPYLIEKLATGAVLVAPNSRGQTWDAIGDGFGPDADFIDASLALAFSRFTIDPARISVVGFSDGATYSIGLGCANGDVFSRIVAHSPGYRLKVTPVAKPPMFITHGTLDFVLPIDVSSRVIVPQLRAEGYDVTYKEFEGGHGVTPELLRETSAWAIA